jgi:hypothetical protein
VGDHRRLSLFMLIDEPDLLPFNLLIRWLMMYWPAETCFPSFS